MTGSVRYRKGPAPSLSSIYTQMWPGKPAYTEDNLPDLQGKVYLVTGGNSGVGKEVVSILYSKNAKVYIGARSGGSARSAIREAQHASPQSLGHLHFLHMDFTDLTTIRPAVDEFKARENRLDCLFNNAGIQSVTDDPVKTAQDWEVHFGVNVLAPFLLTHLLIPTMLETSETDSDVRVVWVCSLSVELLGEKSRGISRDYLQYWPTLSAVERYGISKAGSWLHGAEMAKRFPGITSVPCNPGHLKSNLYRDQNTFLRCALNATILYPPIYGAYTELVAGVSAAVTKQDSGRWMVPWGKWHPIRADLMDATRSTAEGGNGHAQEFWDWCLAQVAQYA